MSEANSDPGRRYGAACVAICGVFVALSAYLIWRSAILQPYSDMLDWVTRYAGFENDHDLGRYLLTPHNLHRLVATLGLVAVDIRVFGGGNILLIVAAAGCLAGLAFLLGREVWRGAPPPVAGSAAAVAVMLCLTPAAVLDASIPINGPYLHGLLFSVWAVVLIEPPDASSGSGGRTAAALLLGMIAAFGSAIAFAIWPVFLYAPVRRRQGVPRLLLIAAVGLGFIVLYAHGAVRAAGITTGDPQAIASVVLRFLGLPWSRYSGPGGAVIGAACLLAGGLALAKMDCPDASHSRRVALNLILFSFVTAAMAGLGRSGGPASADVPLCYGVFMAPAYVGLFILGLDLADRRVTAAWIPKLLAVVSVGLLAQQAIMGSALIRVSDRNRILIHQFKMGERSAQMAGLIYFDLPRAASIAGGIHSRGWYSREAHLPPDVRPSAGR